MEQNKLETKKCSKCGEVKDRSEFHKHKPSKDGLKPRCKACRLAYQKSYDEANSESIKAYKASYYQSNKESIAVNQAEYYKSNKESILDRVSAYKKANRCKYRAAGHRRRSRESNAAGTHTAEQLKARFDYHGNKCVYCDSTENLHADHQIPLSRGGTNFASNMVPACASCNCSKGSKTPEEFLVYQFNVAMEKMING